ncbi:L-threonylcarbamoyladenylate synthase [Leeia oryzae]|uniref:L-threonylcarbamoyladenylate synthase n=1 Tax=Leeia oryzae TaxID=356662 RepID=UPI000687330E|nr:L-threonylcarbamoyladenylate synthase [Leeia oryzae]
MSIRFWPAVRQLRARYKHHGVLAYPTESCFGLGCNPISPLGLKRLLRLKGRPQHKGMIVIAASLAQLRPLLAPLGEQDVAILSRFWPGPFTFLLPAATSVLPLLRGKHQTLAVRVTAHPQASTLCKYLGPLVSTSANKAGQPSLRTHRACVRTFGQHATVIRGLTGKMHNPSSIIDFATGRVLRGHVSEELLQLLKNRTR